MKALFKLCAVLITALIMGGCGTLTGAAVGAHYGGPAGAAVGAGVGAIIDEHGKMHHGRMVGPGGMRGVERGGVGRCEPAQADGLMAWATELDNPQQKRTARVSNSNGRVQCYSSESAGSTRGFSSPTRGVSSGTNTPYTTENGFQVYKWAPPTSGRSSPSSIIDLD